MLYWTEYNNVEYFKQFTLRIKSVISIDFNDLAVLNLGDTCFYITLLIISCSFKMSLHYTLITGMPEVPSLFAFNLLILFKVSANYFYLTWNSEKIYEKLLVTNITPITKIFWYTHWLFIFAILTRKMVSDLWNINTLASHKIHLTKKLFWTNTMLLNKHVSRIIYDITRVIQWQYFHLHCKNRDFRSRVSKEKSSFLTYLHVNVNKILPRSTKNVVLKLNLDLKTD